MAVVYSVATDHLATSRAVFYEGGQYQGAGVPPVADELLIRTDGTNKGVVIAVFSGYASYGLTTSRAQQAANALNAAEGS